MSAIQGVHFSKRLLLGSDAVKIVSAEMKERLQEIEDWSAISKQTDY